MSIYTRAPISVAVLYLGSRTFWTFCLTQNEMYHVLNSKSPINDDQHVKAFETERIEPERII